MWFAMVHQPLCSDPMGRPSQQGSSSPSLSSSQLLLLLCCGLLSRLCCASQSESGVGLARNAQPLPVSMFASRTQVTAVLQPTPDVIGRPRAGAQGTKLWCGNTSPRGCRWHHGGLLAGPSLSMSISAAPMAGLWGALGLAVAFGAVAVARRWLTQHDRRVRGSDWATASVRACSVRPWTGVPRAPPPRRASGLRRLAASLRDQGGQTATESDTGGGRVRLSDGCERATWCAAHKGGVDPTECRFVALTPAASLRPRGRCGHILAAERHGEAGQESVGDGEHMAMALQRLLQGLVSAHREGAHGFYGHLVVPPMPRDPFVADPPPSAFALPPVTDSSDSGPHALARAIGPPLQKVSAAQSSARGFGRRTPPPARPAPRDWGVEDRRAWTRAHVAVGTFLSGFARRVADADLDLGFGLRDVHVVLPGVLARDAELLDLTVKRWVSGLPSRGMMGLATGGFRSLSPLGPELPILSRMTRDGEAALHWALTASGYRSALERYARVARGPAPRVAEAWAAPRQRLLRWHSPAALPASADMPGALVLYVVLLGPDGAVADPGALAEQLATAMRYCRGCRGFTVLGMARPGDAVDAEEADRVLERVLARARDAFRADERAQVPAELLLAAAKTLEHDGGASAAPARVLLTQMAAPGGDAPPAPAVAAARRRLAAALALAAAAEEAAGSCDVAAWREALPQWERARREAQAAGCAATASASLWARVTEAVARATEAVEIEDRLVAATSSIPPDSIGTLTPEQLEELRAALAAAAAAPAPVTAALATRWRVPEASDAVQREALRRAELASLGPEAARRLRAAAEALERGDAQADAALATRASVLAGGDTPPPPAVVAALQRLDAAVALAAAVEEAAELGDAAASRAVLLRLERARQEARAAGCSDSTALWTSAADAGARAAAAADIEDRLVAALRAVPSESTSAVTAVQLQALREVLADAASVPRSAQVEAAEATAARWAAVVEVRAAQAANDVERLGTAIAAAQAAGLDAVQVAMALQAAPDAGLPWQPWEPGEWRPAGERMVWDSAAVLGVGSVGTVVFKGEFQAPGRGPPLPAAIKRLRRDRGPTGEEQLSLVKREVGIVYRLQSKVSLSLIMLPWVVIRPRL